MAEPSSSSKLFSSLELSQPLSVQIPSPPSNFLPTNLWPASFQQRPVLHHSIIVQLDGIVYFVFRLRLDRDVCATSAQTSYCPEFGPWPFLSPASVGCALYYPDYSEIADLLYRVEKQRGFGLFVCPSFIDDGPILQGKNFGETWFRCLRKLSASFVQVSLSGPIIQAQNGQYTEPSVPWMAFFVSFAFQSRVHRRVNRPEINFNVFPILSPNVPLKVWVLPFMPLRFSTPAYEPKVEQDIITASPDFPPSSFRLPATNPCLSPWDQNLFRELVNDYPFPDVANLAIKAIDPAGMPMGFVGDSRKCVIARNWPMTETQQDQVISQYRADVEKGYALEFPSCPFPNFTNFSQPRPYAAGAVPKDKWDPLNVKIRIVSDCSANHASNSSTNQLCFSPKLIGCRTQSRSIFAVIAHLGPGAVADLTDIKDAFKSQLSNPVDWPRMLARVRDTWFLELRHVFGNTTSEFSFAAISACLANHVSSRFAPLNREQVDSVFLHYVDDNHFFSRARCQHHSQLAAQISAVYTAVGAVLHEHQHGTSFKSTGWLYDTVLQKIVCPPKKAEVLAQRIEQWHTMIVEKKPFEKDEIRRVVGLLWFVSVACPSIVPATYNFILLLIKHPAQPRNGIKIDAPARHSFLWLREFWRTWDRTGRITPPISPVYSPTFVIRTDASSLDGCGGVLFPTGAMFMHSWTDAEKKAALQAPSGGTDLVFNSSTFFELLAVEYAIVAFSEIHNQRVQFECDNEGSVKDLRHGYSKSEQCRHSLERIISLKTRLFCVSVHEHLLGVYNTIAHLLSHGDLIQASEALSTALQLPTGSSTPSPLRVVPNLAPSTFDLNGRQHSFQL